MAGPGLQAGLWQRTGSIEMIKERKSVLEGEIVLERKRDSEGGGPAM